MLQIQISAFSHLPREKNHIPSHVNCVIIPYIAVPIAYFYSNGTYRTIIAKTFAWQVIQKDTRDS
jgi:hypothetical protein